MIKEDIAATKNFFLQKNANEIFPQRSSLPRLHYWDFEFSEIFVYVILFSPCMDVKQILFVSKSSLLSPNSKIFVIVESLCLKMVPLT